MGIAWVFIAMLAATSIILMKENRDLKVQVDSVKNSLHFSQIQWDFVQLEGAIAYQIKNRWEQPSHVREKVGDVLQDIMVILEVNSRVRFLSEEEKGYLDSLYWRLGKYPKDNMVKPINGLSQEETDKFIQLQKALRDVEWGIGFSNSGHWDSFIEKLIKLLPQI